MTLWDNFGKMSTPFYPFDEERTRRSLAHLAAIVDSSDDAIVSKTLEGVITSWNRAAERMFGWSSAEAVGRHITLIIPEERLAEEDEVLARIRRGDRVDHFDTVRVTKDRRHVDVSITVSPIRDETGRIIGASKIARDISARLRMDEERAHLLEREQEARRQAEELNRTKDELLATVSHELRTPLNSIFGWARMLQAGSIDEAQRTRAVNAILRGAAAQSRLVEDLLDMSRIVTGRMRMDFQLVDLTAVIEAALEAVRPAADAKHITVIATLAPSGARVRGAPDRLQQVMWNLLMNAVKFTPQNGRMSVAVEPGDGVVHVVVADNGEGIAPSALPHIFEPFRQEDSSITRTHGGLGLGLTLVRQLVELHGGHVRAESGGKGQGARFTVALPLATPRAAAPHDLAVGPEAAPALRSTLRGVRVLVVDDDPDSLEMSAMVLREAGADVRAASSAFRAYEVMRAWQPTVVLTDLAMPGEDGFMLTRGLKAAFGRRGVDVPVIALTAYGTPDNRSRALEAGFDVYLTKPIDPVELAGVIEEVVHRAG